ncbi:delta-aminolevulinic acid dehydratase, partial [Candidatus Neomarinimicrobiota bacterium]
VYNASLLGSKLLTRIYYYTKNKNLLKVAKKSVNACINAQNDDGSWIYGELGIQNWIDSFHTGYNLESISDYQKYSKDHSFDKNIEIGINYYINNFFLNDGTPKYYHDKVYPTDIHCSAQLIVTLFHLNKLQKYNGLVNQVLHWTITNMQDKKGYFYYQKRKYWTNKIPYMRWSQAFMFYALSYYLLLNKSDS